MRDIIEHEYIIPQPHWVHHWLSMAFIYVCFPGLFFAGGVLYKLDILTLNQGGAIMLFSMAFMIVVSGFVSKKDAETRAIFKQEQQRFMMNRAAKSSRHWSDD